jgi:intracellular septation protein A
MHKKLALLAALLLAFPTPIHTKHKYNPPPHPLSEKDHAYASTTILLATCVVAVIFSKDLRKSPKLKAVIGVIALFFGIYTLATVARHHLPIVMTPIPLDQRRKEKRPLPLFRKKRRSRYRW